MISKVSKVMLVVAALPIAAVAELVSTLFQMKEKRSAREVATYISNFIEGRGGDWDWDDFTSVSIEDPELDDIRNRAAAIDLPAAQEGLVALQGLLSEAEQLVKLEPDA